ncbi:MAG: hypothetical protein OJF47_001863 [Nitrospira sp.]|nr:MAG: hypothetical protein OJF47_001863 [Nitrospira sp.]
MRTNLLSQQAFSGFSKLMKGFLPSCHILL